MLETIMAHLASFITGSISAMGYAGIALLMAIESACIPLPSEIIMPFSGYLVSTGRFNLWLVATAGAVGCNIGSTLAYIVGAWGGRPLIDRWGRYVLLDKTSLATTERFFDRYGDVAVFVSRLLPVVRTFVSLPAGIARMPFLRFQIYTFVGSWFWCLALAWVGMRLGEAWNDSPALRRVLHGAHGVIAVLLVLGVAWFVHHQLRARQR